MDWIIIILGSLFGIYVLFVGGTQTVQRAWPVALVLGIVMWELWVVWALVECFLPTPRHILEARGIKEEDHYE